MADKTKKAEISYIKSASGTLMIYADGKAYSVKSDHRNYDEIVAALRKGDSAEIKRLADVGEYLSNYSTGAVKVENGRITYNGTPVHNGITKRIFELQKAGFNFGYMAKFLDNLMKNPSFRATQELYDFLAHRNLPITDDGCFLAYKNVKQDFTDHHTGTFDNNVGKTVSMERNAVDDERRNGCSNGLHVGTIEYAREFNSGGRLIICKVNPADVVSVPTDCSCQKLRTCKYEVLDEYTGDLTATVYSASVRGITPLVADQLKESIAAAKLAAEAAVAPTPTSSNDTVHSAAPHPSDDEDDEDEDDDDDADYMS